VSNDPPHYPDPNEIQEEFSRLIKEKYGNSVQVRFMPQFTARPAESGGGGPEAEPPEPRFDLDFNLTPQDIKHHLDRYVIGQDEAKKVLSTAVCDHYNHVLRLEHDAEYRRFEKDYQKQNVILIGSTGIGKTYLVRTIAELIQVPFVRSDATKFSETGYVGGDVEDLVRELVHRAKGDIRRAECGIIYLDEIDKVATPEHLMGRDVSGRGVQMGLLKLMEDTDVPVRAPMDLSSQLQAMMEFQSKGKAERKTINTRNILFIVSGAFTGLTKIVRRRVASRPIGFGQAESFDKKEEFELLSQAKSTDFVEFGFEPEFIGRLPVSVACHDLTVEHLYEILTRSEGSLVHQVRESFRAYGIDAVFADEGLRRIAELAIDEDTGARGLGSVLERTLREFKFRLPSGDVRRFVVTRRTVDDPPGEIERVLEGDEYNERLVRTELLREYEAGFRARHQIAIHFDEPAVEAIISKSIELGVEPAEVCAPLLRGYEHGLNLIRANTGQEEFVITREVLERPTEVLNRWIKEACGGTP
jgi:endopeptidase Clp ATP-binding regulatory subunit ClpX